VSDAVRTRFAPSPTGYLHLGSARTALYSWAYARRHGGAFVLRIEDTDRERSTEASEHALLDGLRWLGLDWDEGPARQSEGRPRHDAIVEELLERGRAYRCVCTREQLEERRHRSPDGHRNKVYDGRCRDLGLGPDCGPHTVRLRMAPDTMLGWDDLVFGPSGQASDEIGDMIVRRSDGSPLYNLAVVADDLEMRISHVIRGADHHSNTPLQIAIYRALDRRPPAFAHVPLIVGASGKKLSKRRDPVSIQHYRDEGYLPEAMLNWLVRLGWSHGDEEVFSLAEIATLFDLAHVGRSGAQADVGKLAWLNQHYLKELPADALLERLDPFLERRAGAPAPRNAEGRRLLDLCRERAKTLDELAERMQWLVADPPEVDEKAAKKHLTAAAAPLLDELRRGLEGLDEWSEAAIEQAFEAVCRDRDVKMGKLAQPARVAATGTAASPGIFETIWVLGPTRAVARLGAAAERARARGAG